MIPPHTVRIEFNSAFDMLDFVQVVSDHISHDVGLDEDAIHWVGVAVRECVINAIKHGNRNDAGKHVFMEFHGVVAPDSPEITIAVRDQGDGFDPVDAPSMPVLARPRSGAAA